MNLSMTGAQVFDWLVSLFNFGVMFAVFRLVCIIPVQEAVRLREQRVKLRLKEIDELARDAEAQKLDFEGKFGDVDAVLAEVKDASDRSEAQALAKVEEKAVAEEKYLLEKAQAEAESIARGVEAEIRSKVTSLAVARAEALLVENLGKGDHGKIVAASVKKVGELHAS